MKKTIKFVAILTVLTILAVPSVSSAARKQVFFAAGSPGGTYEMIGTAMTKIFNDFSPNYEMVPMTFTSTSQIPTALTDGEVALGIANSDAFERAWAGVDDFKGNASPNIRQVMAVYDNLDSFFTLKSGKYKAVDEFDDKTIVATAPGNLIFIQHLFEVMHEMGYLKKTTPKKLMANVKPMTYTQCAEQLSDGNVDVTFITCWPYNGTADSLVSTKGGMYIPVSNDPATEASFCAKWNATYPIWTTQPMQAGSYASTEKTIQCPTVYTMIYAINTAPADLIQEFIEICVQHADKIAAIHIAGKDISLETNIRYYKSGIMPESRMHEGTKNYLKKNNVLQSAL